MNRRTVFAALAAVSLCTVTGAVAARQGFFNPFRDRADQSGNVWQAVPYFRGQVALFDAHGKSLGTSGTDGSSSDGGGTVSADVTINEHKYPVSGAGRHELRNANGVLLGTAVLTPQTTEEREAWWAQHEKRLGHDESLPGESAANDGWGMASGYFGGASARLSWRLRGVAEARFRRADNGHVVRRGLAGPLADAERSALRKELGPQEYAASVAPTVPATPVFTWTTNQKTVQWVGFGTHALTLPDGTALTVQIMPYSGQ